MNIKYYEDIKILGFHMTAKIKESAKNSWAMLTSKIRTHTQNAYHRALNLDDRIRYINEVILAAAWYTTQIFPLPTDSVRQMNTAISWFIRKGAIFKVPLSTLQLPKEAGGRALIHIMATCMTLFLLRMEKQGHGKATFTTDWLTRWYLHERTPNFPQIRRIPAKFDYLYHYNIEAAYTPIRCDSENHKAHKKRLHAALLTSIRAASGSPEMHIQKLWSNTDRTRIWKNLKEAAISDNTRCIWYQVVQDLTPTNVRLYCIKMTPSTSC